MPMIPISIFLTLNTIELPQIYIKIQPVCWIRVLFYEVFIKISGRYRWPAGCLLSRGECIPGYLSIRGLRGENVRVTLSAQALCPFIRVSCRS